MLSRPCYCGNILEVEHRSYKRAITSEGETVSYNMICKSCGRVSHISSVETLIKKGGR